MTHQYELMVILDPEIDERTVAPSLDKFLNVIRTDGGSIDKVDVWGRRRLAYEINKKSEGIYAIDTFIYRRNDTRFSTDTAINVPVLVWSTGYKFLGANIQPLLAQPTVFGFPNNPAGVPNRDFTVNVGTLVGSIFAWDLGNGFGVSYLAAVHLNDLDAGRGLPQFSSNTYRQGFAASYTADGWNLTANLTHNFYDSPGR